MKKSRKIYVFTLILWIFASMILIASLVLLIIKLSWEENLINSIFIAIMLTFNTVILAILWLGSIKDFMYSFSFIFLKKKINKEYQNVINHKVEKSKKPKFLLLYCTCNDFNKEALFTSMKQDYENYETIILDDSSDSKYIAEINEFKNKHKDKVKLIRRKDKKGFKAGNLNNFLNSYEDYDYFIVLDSDEIIPKNYIKEAIKYFDYYPKCGAVQAKHECKKGSNFFQNNMGMGVKSNGSIVQVMKNFYGANALIGHGMTISKECYKKVGGFPLVVAEDISMAVEIKNKGFEIIYAPNILCYEEFPINYPSLKKRQCKWVQGNLEYMKKYDKDINNSKMSWFEKFDIKLSHYSLPIVPILSVFLLISMIILGFLGYKVIDYSIGVYILMMIFLCSPLIPDIFTYHSSKNIFLLIPYFLINIATYASLAPMMIITVIKGLFKKKARFIVTPKEEEKFKFLEAIKYSYDSLIFGSIIAIFTIISCNSILPSLLIVISCLISPLLILSSNILLKKNNNKQKLKRT